MQVAILYCDSINKESIYMYQVVTFVMMYAQAKKGKTPQVPVMCSLINV